MKIPCFRCGAEIDTPGIVGRDKKGQEVYNADYVIAQDMIVKEPRSVLLALIHNPATLAKKEEQTDIKDEEYDAVEIPNFEASKTMTSDVAKVVCEERLLDIEKSGVVCPGGYKPDDTVIWGVHKKKEA